MLHAISSIPALANWISTHVHADAHSSSCILCDLQSDVQHLRYGSTGQSIVPRLVKSRATWSDGYFAGARDQDAHEAWNIICTCILETNTEKEHSVFQSIMGGSEQSSRVCKNALCRRKHITQPDTWISLQLWFQQSSTRQPRTHARSIPSSWRS